MVLVALLINVFSGNWGEMGIPIGPDRLLFAGGLLLAWLDPRIPRPQARALHAMMLVFTAWTLASMLLLSTVDTGTVFALLDRVVMPFLLFATAPMLFRTSFERLLLLRGLTLLGLYLASVAVLQSVGAHGLVFPRYIVGGVIDASVPAADAARAGGPFLSGEGNGMALGLCAVAAFLLARLDRGAWRVVGLVAGSLAAVASILSLTRAIWLGVALAVVVVVLLRRQLWRWVPIMAVVGAVLAGAGVAAMPTLVDNIVDRGTTSRSLYDRQNSNAAAVRAIEEHPLVGVGWARFGEIGPDWVRQADTYPVTTVNIEVHNVVLSRAVDLGLPAGLLFVAILLAGPGAAIVRRRADPEEEEWRLAVIAATCVWFVPSMTSPIPYPFPTFTFFLLAGLLWAFPRERLTQRERIIAHPARNSEGRNARAK